MSESKTEEVSESKTEDEVRERLTNVLDPCSCFTDRPINIVDLGLVEDVTVTGDEVVVEILPTSVLCLYVPNISSDIKQEVGSVDGIEEVQVKTASDKVWTSDRIAAQERQIRRDQFQSRVEKDNITPHEFK